MKVIGVPASMVARIAAGESIEISGELEGSGTLTEGSEVELIPVPDSEYEELVRLTPAEHMAALTKIWKDSRSIRVKLVKASLSPERVGLNRLRFELA